jgi:hypothetical protein
MPGKFENCVVRDTAVLKWTGDRYVEEILNEKHPVPDGKDLGFRVICSNTMIKGSDIFIEYGYVKENGAKGTGKDYSPHKHPYPEVFLFIGTNPDDLSDLGAEVEFWLGEGKDLSKIVLKKPGSIYVPPNVAHFPQIWRNVKRPVLNLVVMPKGTDMSYSEVKRPELAGDSPLT